MTTRFTIVGIGEALFDVFDAGPVLGGAPLNVAVHAHQLAAARDGRGVVVSRVGQDDLGRQLTDELSARGMSIEHIQTDPDRDTGRVYVDVDAAGNHQFQIVADVAWDVLQFDPLDEDLARRCDAVCFGTLAQRDAQCRNSIYRFLDTTRRRAVRMFDVNLRQEFYDQRIIDRSCEMATVVKLNDKELPIVCDLLGLGHVGVGEIDEVDRKAQALRKQFELDLVALTRGAQGTVLFDSGGKHESDAVSYPAADSADAVGAGDACTAALLLGLVQHLPLDKTLNLANHCGAYVAAQPGAAPELPDAILEMAR